MKKLVILTMVVALFIGIPFCIFAQEQRRDVPRLCKAAEFAIADYVENLGQCVRYVQACSESEHSPDWCICVLIRAVNLQAYEDLFKTRGLGPCIEYSRANY